MTPTIALQVLVLLFAQRGWFFAVQPSAALWEDQLFVAANDKMAYGRTLYRGTFQPEEKAVRVPVAYGLSSAYRTASQIKLDVRDDRVLVDAGDLNIFPLADLPLLEQTAFGDKLRATRGYKSYSGFCDRYTGGGGDLLFPEHREPDIPVKAPPDDELARINSELAQHQARVKYGRMARCSTQISGPKAVRLFHAHKDKLFVSVEPDYLTDWFLKDGRVAPNLPKPPDRQLRTGKLPADFTERFAIYTADKVDYLVTDNGKAYLIVPKGKTEVEVSTVWDDPKRRIVGVVQDLANDAVYGWGFVASAAAPERFYVKLAAKPVAVGYNRTVPLWGEESDAYLESYECARAARKAADKNNKNK